MGLGLKAAGDKDKETDKDKDKDKHKGKPVGHMYILFPKCTDTISIHQLHHIMLNYLILLSCLITPAFIHYSNNVRSYKAHVL